MLTYEGDSNLGNKLLVNIILFGLKVSSTTENCLNLSFVSIFPSPKNWEGLKKGIFLLSVNWLFSFLHQKSNAALNQSYLVLSSQLFCFSSVYFI